MSDGTRGNGKRDSQPPDDAALSARLRRLGERLDHTGAGRPPPADPASRSAANASAMARGFRLSTELVAAVLAGALLGWALDHLVGSSPWGMIVFLLFGFAAGVLNVVRAAGAGGASPVTGTDTAGSAAARVDDDDED